MKTSLPNGFQDSLLWCEEKGIGYHTQAAMEYKDEYFDKYIVMDATEQGAALTKARVGFVRKHYAGEVLDIGIGGGRFVTEINGYGYDVNKKAIDWLGNKYLDPYKQHVEAATCWDSLEHMADPAAFVDRVSEWVFVSMPIYKNMLDCLASKHYKPGEHIWYWTFSGLVGWFENLGFFLVESNDIESRLGREDIYSFAFRRIL